MSTMGTCTVCSGALRVHLRCGTYTLLQCARCGLISLANIPPQRVLNTYYEDAFYDRTGERFNPVLEVLVRLFRRNRARLVLRLAARQDITRGKVLDVGFSRGMMLRLLKDKGWESSGITNSRNVLRHGRQIGLRVQYGELPTARFPRSSFDVITFWHVLEHVRQPMRYLRASHRLLKSDGMLLIEVPNSASIPARLFGCRWLGLDLPRHLHHFTPASLTAMLDRTGFSVQRIQYFSLEHSTFSLLQSMLNGITGTSNVTMESLKKSSHVPLWRRLPHLLLAVVLLPLAAPLAVLCAAFRQGDIMRLICVKG